MRHFHCVKMLVTMLLFAAGLAGCQNFDPEQLDFLNLNSKKPLPGDRKPLFADGVPGVTQGIPPEYLRGNVEQQTGAAVDVPQTPAAQPGAVADGVSAPNARTAVAEPATEAKPETAATPKPKPKPKRRVVRRTPATAPTRATTQKSDPQGQKPASWPEQAQARPQPASQPASQAQAPWPAPAQDGVAPWPSAPPAGTFSK